MYFYYRSNNIVCNIKRSPRGVSLALYTTSLQILYAMLYCLLASSAKLLIALLLYSFLYVTVLNKHKIQRRVHNSAINYSFINFYKNIFKTTVMYYFQAPHYPTYILYIILYALRSYNILCFYLYLKRSFKEPKNST